MMTNSNFSPHLPVLQRLALAIVLTLTLLTGLTAYAQDEIDPVGRALADLVAATDLAADWLAQHEDYQINASGPDDNGIWYIEFYTADWEEWLGYANIQQDTGDIADSFFPLPLPQDVYQNQQQRLMPFVLADAEVRAWLDGNPDLWDVYPDWNRWDQRWEVHFSRGIRYVDVWVQVDADTEEVTLTDIVDPNVLEAEAQVSEARNRAINLAYSAPGIDAALDGHDDWYSYAENQRGSVWSVTFAADDRTLFFALIDIAAESILSTRLGG